MSVSPRLRIALFGLAVGIVLADSSVVTIALPEIMSRYDVDVETLAWALTSFNLGLAVAALPAAYVARPRPRPIFATGAVVFASASIMCAVAPSFAVFVAARAVQGIAGAAVVCAALDFLIAATPTSARAVRLWALAGILGAALGPAAGGRTDPTGRLGGDLRRSGAADGRHPGGAGGRARVAPALRPAGRPHLGANAALLLVSGALVGALFLLVILLINGWRLEPLVAGAVVTVMPIAALVAVRFGPTIPHLWARAASGAILISGGLAALAWLPEAGAAWTIPPQLAVGAGLGLALSALTVRAPAGRPSPAIHGGWTIAARHAGVVLGLLVLTPIFTTDLEQRGRGARGRHVIRARQPSAGAGEDRRCARHPRRGGQGRRGSASPMSAKSSVTEATIGRT